MATAPLGPVCAASFGPGFIDSGTACLWASAAPADPHPAPTGPAPWQVDAFKYTPAVQTTVSVAFPVAAQLTWDGFLRLIYDQANSGYQAQARKMLQLGLVDAAEADRLVTGRNDLLLRIRRRLSPWGELYSEILKPRASLKSFEQFLAEKGTIEAVLRSVGKTRASVDRFAAVSRVAGPALIVLDITLTAVVIQQARSEDRARVAATEVGGLLGSTGLGLGGMWAGCASAAWLASPTLVLPVIGPVTTGTACVVGAMFGGLGASWLGREAGQWVGGEAHDWVQQIDDFHWVLRT